MSIYGVWQPPLFHLLVCRVAAVLTVSRVELANLLGLLLGEDRRSGRHRPLLSLPVRRDLVVDATIHRAREVNPDQSGFRVGYVALHLGVLDLQRISEPSALVLHPMPVCLPRFMTDELPVKPRHPQRAGRPLLVRLQLKGDEPEHEHADDDERESTEHDQGVREVALLHPTPETGADGEDNLRHLADDGVIRVDAEDRLDDGDADEDEEEAENTKDGDHHRQDDTYAFRPLGSKVLLVLPAVWLYLSNESLQSRVTVILQHRERRVAHRYATNLVSRVPNPLSSLDEPELDTSQMGELIPATLLWGLAAGTA